MVMTPERRIENSLDSIKSELSTLGCCLFCILIALIFVAIGVWRIGDALR